MGPSDTQEYLCPWRWKSGSHWLWTGTTEMKLHPRLILCAMSQSLAGGSTLSWAAAPGCRGSKLGWLQYINYAFLAYILLIKWYCNMICVNLRECMILKHAHDSEYLWHVFEFVSRPLSCRLEGGSSFWLFQSVSVSLLSRFLSRPK